MAFKVLTSSPMIFPLRNPVCGVTLDRTKGAWQVANKSLSQRLAVVSTYFRLVKLSGRTRLSKLYWRVKDTYLTIDEPITASARCGCQIAILSTITCNLARCSVDYLWGVQASFNSRTQVRQTNQLRVAQVSRINNLTFSL